MPLDVTVMSNYYKKYKCLHSLIVLIFLQICNRVGGLYQFTDHMLSSIGLDYWDWRLTNPVHQESEHFPFSNRLFLYQNLTCYGYIVPSVLQQYLACTYGFFNFHFISLQRLDIPSPLYLVNKNFVLKRSICICIFTLFLDKAGFS